MGGRNYFVRVIFKLVWSDPCIFQVMGAYLRSCRKSPSADSCRKHLSFVLLLWLTSIGLQSFPFVAPRPLQTSNSQARLPDTQSQPTPWVLPKWVVCNLNSAIAGAAIASVPDASYAKYQHWDEAMEPWF